MFEVQILQSVIQQERIDFPFIDGYKTALDAIFIHEHDHVLQIVRQHVRLIAGSARIQQQRFAVGHNAWRIGVSSAQPIEPASFAGHAFVTATQNCDPTPTCLQGTSKFFHNRCFAGATHSQVADADDETSKRALAKDSFPVEIKAQLHEPVVSE